MIRNKFLYKLGNFELLYKNIYVPRIDWNIPNMEKYFGL